MHGNGIQDAMLKLGSKQPLNGLEDGLGVLLALAGSAVIASLAVGGRSRAES